jgi:hypothetical protein
VQGQSIADLQIVNTSAVPTPTSAIRPNVPHIPQVLQQQRQQQIAIPPLVDASMPAHKPSQRQPSDFVDPAILSYGKNLFNMIPVSNPI